MTDKPEMQKNRYGNYRGQHPNSRANIKPAGEVQSLRFGPAVSLVALIRQELTNIPDEVDGKPNNEKLTNAKLIVKRIIQEAVDGNASLAREVLDRIDGRPTQAISGPEGRPIAIQQSIRLGSAEIGMALEALLLHGVMALAEDEEYPRLEEGGDDGEASG